MLVFPQQLFLDDLQCTLMTSSIVLHLKTHSIPKSKFGKILVENTTIIAHKTDKLQLQILEALHTKTKKKSLINRINFENSDIVLKCFWYIFNIPYSLIVFYFRL